MKGGAAFKFGRGRGKHREVDDPIMEQMTFTLVTVVTVHFVYENTRNR